MSPATAAQGAARRRAGVVSLVVLAIVAAGFTWFATRAQGEIVRKTDLFDGGIWVSNSASSTFGRLNKPAQQLDAGVAAAQDTSASGIDVLQDDAAVLAVSKASNQATPIDAESATIATSGALTLPAPATATGLAYAQQLPIDLRGGTAAVVDPTTGKLWAARVDTTAGTVASLDQLLPQVKPLATVGATAAVAVGTDGTVYAASAASGTLVTLRVDAAAGGFAAPVTTKLGFTSKAVEVTAVGDRWVAFDPATSRLYAAGLSTPAQLTTGDPAAGGLAQAALQQPGPADPSVLVETAQGLLQVALDSGSDTSSGTVVTLPDAARQTPTGTTLQVFLTAPVRLGSCVHAAWAGPASVWYGRSCGAPEAGAGDAAAPSAVQLTGLDKGTRTDGVRLRTNRGLIVLNDLDTGTLWDVDNTPLKIDNWDSVIPPPQQQDQNDKKDPNQVDDQVIKTPPQAQPDQLKVRAGRTSTLHVLDNDSDAAGSILGIAPGDVTQPTVAGVTTSVSADGQTVEVSVPDGLANSSFGFSYTVNNGSGGATSRSTARVSVQVVDDSVNTPPTVRQGTATLSSAKYAVVQGGHVTVGVIADWRDAENDPLSIEADDSGVGVDPSGALTVTAGTTAGTRAVKYHVSDGQGGSSPGQVAVTVLRDTDRAVPPVSQPDVVRAIIGKPVQVEPLANDVPGADPTYPDARMQLAAPLRAPGQLVVDTNLDTDVVTLTGSVAGTFFLSYGAQVGNAVGAGRIRVDVLPDPSGDSPPVAVPDSATLKAELPVVTDVLANDYSPRGDVLVVQKVTSTDPWIRASVLQGRFVRVQATGPVTQGDLRRAALTYTVSDGTGTADGQLSVVQKVDDGRQLVPDVVDDEAVVRTGDVVTIPVLDNDTVSGGVPLVLDPTVKVIASTGAKGEAFASGNVVRYVPDATPVTEDTVVTLEYSTHPEGGTTSVSGRVTVTVKPLPTPTTPDQAPVARSFSASVTAGDTITLTVPTSGIDPDGDLGYVVGVVGAQEGAIDLSLGRVTSTGAATIRYEAYPRSAGTELIRYSLRDRFNKTGEGIIRVGVVQPGDPQPPVAVEDDVVAAPGRTITFDPMANDLVAPDDQVEYEDLAARNDASVVKQFTRNADGTFSTRAPAEDSPLVLDYGITDGLFDPSRTTVTVRGREGFNNAPIAVDDTPQPKAGDTALTVDVLANDRDPDNSHDRLRVVSATGEGVTVVGGTQVRVTLLDHPRVVPYVITDDDPDHPLQAMALIYVPTADSGVPFVTAGRVIQMNANSTLKVDLADYVTDPRGRAVRVTSPDTVSTSPRTYLGPSLTGAAEVTLTSKGDYTGPAALMLQVTDATGATDTAGVTAYLSIPVQVGPLTPVLRCPSYEVDVVADGPSRTVDVPRLCHAWFPTGLDPASVTYAATWSQRISRVDLTQQGTGGSQLALRAEPAAPTAAGTITYGVKGGQQFTLRVRVTQAPPLSVRPITVAGLVAGQSTTVDVSRYLDSPLADPRCSLTGVRTLDNAAVGASVSGCRVTLTARSDARRQATVAFTVSDAPGRSVDGRIGVTIKAPPDAPTGVTAVADVVAGGQARVAWVAPAYDGGFPVEQYEVAASGQKTQLCSASPCTITGLKNGVAVSFTVRARNAVGWSPLSAPSSAVKPDLVPDRVTVGAVTPGDRTLTVTWSPPPSNGGSAVTVYEIHWVDKDGGSAGGVRQVSGSTTSTVLTGLVNDDRYGLTIRAKNDLGFGPPGPEVVKQSVGTPATVPAPKVVPRTPTPDDDSAQLTVTWQAVDPNGPALTGYTVYRDGKQIATTSPDTRTIADSVPYDGATHQYLVTATNGGNKTSARGTATAFVANGIPQTPTRARATTPTDDYAAQGTWQVGDSHAAGYRQLQWQTDAGSGSFDCSGQTCPAGGQLPNLGTSAQTLRIRVINTAGTPSAWSAPSDPFTPFGPTKGVTGLRETHDNTSVTFTWDATPENGRPLTGYRLGGDVSTTVGPGTTSYTFSGLGYSTSRSLTVTAEAQDSGAGPTSGTVTGTTNPRPPDPKVTPVQNGSCYAATCNSQNPAQCGNSAHKNCEFVAIAVTDWVAGRTYCTITDTPDTGGIPGRYHADTGTSGTFQLYNDSNYRPFYGQGGHNVNVSCTDPAGHTFTGSSGGW